MGESKAGRQRILDKLGQTAQSFLHDRMRATNDDAREQSRYVTWFISLNPPLLTVLFLRIAHFYRACVFGYKAPGINLRDVDHRFFGVDETTGLGFTTNPIVQQATIAFFRTMVPLADVFNLGDFVRVLKYMPNNPITAGFAVENAVLCAIATFGVGNIVQELTGHIESFQFEGDTPPAISPNDGVWLWCPNKYNLKGLDGYLLQTRSLTEAVGNTVNTSREFVIRAIQITLAKDSHPNSEATFKQMRTRLAALAPAGCTIRYEMWWIATRSEIAASSAPDADGDFAFLRRYITFTDIHPDIETAIEANKSCKAVREAKK